jgi:transcriptional regulator with XRE-family HTH domain
VENKITEAVRQIISDTGSLTKFAKKSGLSTSVIHNILTGKSKVDNITLGTLRRMFPELQISFFKPGNLYEISDHLSAAMIEDWKILDEDERAEVIAAVKRIIKARPLRIHSNMQKRTAG